MATADWSRNARLAAAAAVLVLAPGCFWLAAGAVAGGAVGGYAYANGVLSKEYPQGLERVWTATHRALDALSIKVIEDSGKDALKGTIQARRGDDTKVTIDVISKSDRVTEARIRVGVFGDRDVSQRIHEELQKYLD